MNTYIGSAKYEYVTSLRSSWTTSNLSSALYTDSMFPAESRLRNFILTTAELRPDLLYSAFCTTMASLPIITTLPTRSSCAVFIIKKLSCTKIEPDRCDVAWALLKTWSAAPSWNLSGTACVGYVRTVEICRRTAHAPL